MQILFSGLGKFSKERWTLSLLYGQMLIYEDPSLWRWALLKIEWEKDIKVLVPSAYIGNCSS